LAAKLLNFAETAEACAEFAQELPEFLCAIRDVFSVQETGDHAVQLNAPRFSPLQRHALRAISSGSGVRSIDRQPAAVNVRENIWSPETRRKLRRQIVLN
jgi:hypothetical protein